MPADQRSVHLGTRFEAALLYANQVHGGQCRKGTGVPYVAHLLGVASLVLEDGGDEDEAIAALLHDAEDQGGHDRLADIRARFGERVAPGCHKTSQSQCEGPMDEVPVTTTGRPYPETSSIAAPRGCE